MGINYSNGGVVHPRPNDDSAAYLVDPGYIITAADLAKLGVTRRRWKARLRRLRREEG